MSQYILGVDKNILRWRRRKPPRMCFELAENKSVDVVVLYVCHFVEDQINLWIVYFSNKFKKKKSKNVYILQKLWAILWENEEINKNGNLIIIQKMSNFIYSRLNWIGKWIRNSSAVYYNKRDKKHLIWFEMYVNWYCFDCHFCCICITLNGTFIGCCCCFWLLCKFKIYYFFHEFVVFTYFV